MTANASMYRRTLVLLVVVPMVALIAAADEKTPVAEPSAVALPLEKRGPFHDAIFRLRRARTGRVSSWDRTGNNRDFVSFKPGETKELLKLAGPGCITHIYLTPMGPPTILRTLVLRMYWEGETSPSVEVPFGDFFCTGECNVRLFASHFVVVNHGTGTTAYNAYFPMPFRKLARVTLENTDTNPIGYFWYHIEYELYEQDLPADTAYFHAQWRREKTTRVQHQGHEAVPEEQVNRMLWSAQNRTGEENYVILQAEGTGHVVGLFLTCNNLADGWWGEGDDMIFIDGEKWPPSYHGTGTEEIFGGGACPNEEYSGPYTGFVAINEQKATTWRGQNSMYRWYVHDPIRFQRSIRWTIEHGHANNFENDYSSVAYWYQTEPHKPFPQLPKDRLPSGGVATRPSAPAIPGLIEAELLLTNARHHGGEVLPIDSGRSYSRGRLVLFRATGPRSWLAFRIEVEKAGKYQVRGRFARASDMGRYRLVVDSKVVGEPTNFYNGTGGSGPTHVVPSGDVAFGEIELTKGEHEFKLECVGKDEQSTGHFLGVDGFALNRL